MGRPAKGYVRFNPSTSTWEVRVSRKDGTRSKPIEMPKIPACLITPDAPVSGCTCVSCVAAIAGGAKISRRVRNGATVDAATSETVSEWFGRYYEWRGGESEKDSRGRFKNWIEPKIGTMPMVRVTRETLEDLVTFLDEKVGEEAIAAKTALNIWGEITAAFNVATKGKDKSLRLLQSNPADGVAGPDDGDTKQKPFLRPVEIVKLLSCDGPDGVPLERRQAYAVAIYTAMRQAELRALRVRDVDLDAMQISVTKQLKDGVEKERTKNGRARTVQIEPNLVPLLEVLMKGKEKDDRILSVGARNRCASNLREDLILAGCDREALHVPKSDKLRVHLKFHNLKDTCGTHMAVRRDPPQDIQWRLAHSDAKTTEIYISNAKNEAGANFGAPLAPLPAAVLQAPPRGMGSVTGGDSGGTTRVVGVDLPIATRPVKRAYRRSAVASRVDSRQSSIPGASTIFPTDRDGFLPEKAEPRQNSQEPETAPPQDAPGPVPTAAPVDPVEAALVSALNAATVAGKWDVVAQLARDLEARRIAKLAPGAAPHLRGVG